MTEQELEYKITYWHEMYVEDPNDYVTLHEFLGWTWEQYKHWVETDEMP